MIEKDAAFVMSVEEHEIEARLFGQQCGQGVTERAHPEVDGGLRSRLAEAVTGEGREIWTSLEPDIPTASAGTEHEADRSGSQASAQLEDDRVLARAGFNRLGQGRQPLRLPPIRGGGLLELAHGKATGHALLPGRGSEIQHLDDLRGGAGQ